MGISIATGVALVITAVVFFSAGVLLSYRTKGRTKPAADLSEKRHLGVPGAWHS